MANANVTRLGQINQAGDNRALFLKVFSGEILAAYDEETIMDGKHLVKSIAAGKSAQFPASGRIGAEYHVPGAEILGDNMNHAEVVISIDAQLISHCFFADIDEAMNHYETRGVYAKRMGEALAKEFDINVLSEGILGARAAATVSDLPGGSQITSDLFQLGATAPAATTVAEQAEALISAIYQARQIFDENYAPKDRYIVFRPAEYLAIVQAVQSNGFSAIHKDYDGNGSFSKGTVMEIAGITILVSNNLPSTDLSAKTYHAGNFEKTIALAWAGMESIGTVKLIGLGMESSRDPRRLGDLVVASMAVGHGFLRPESLIEFELDTLTN